MVGAEPGEGRAAVAYCDEPECLRKAVRNGKCWGHVKQLQRRGRTGRLAEKPVDPRERVLEALYALADVDAEDDRAYRRAERRFWDAVRALKLEEARVSTLGRRLRS